jgi:peptidoglycan/LPS O-acetylase OafA/YrhL
MTNTARPSPIGYRPALDGIRAVAVLAVLAGHSGWLSGGFLGVDVFFALSGFLITTLLTEEYDASGSIALSLFYARRALRLLPALLLLVVVCTGILLATLPAELGPLALHEAAAVVFYLANWAWVFGLPLGIYGHTWSLGIEEQFYLLWPLALLALIRAGIGRAGLAGITLVAAGLGVLWRIALLHAGASLLHLHQGLDTHGDALLIGCATALAIRAGLTRTGGVGWGSSALLVILFCSAAFPDDYVHRHVSTLAALAAAMLIADVMLRPCSWLARGLAVQPLAALGRISYGVYLWHFPVFYMYGALAYAGARPASWTAAVAAWTTTLAVAGVSYVAFERPILAFKATVRRTQRHVCVRSCAARGNG